MSRVLVSSAGVIAAISSASAANEECLRLFFILVSIFREKNPKRFKELRRKRLMYSELKETYFIDC